MTHAMRNTSMDKIVLLTHLENQMQRAKELTQTATKQNEPQDNSPEVETPCMILSCNLRIMVLQTKEACKSEDQSPVVELKS